MGVVVGLLDPAAAVRLVHRDLHRGRDRIGVHHDVAVGVAGGAADCLDQRRFGAEEAFFIRVEDRDERDLRDVEPLAEEVDPDEHVERPEP